MYYVSHSTPFSLSFTLISCPKYPFTNWIKTEFFILSVTECSTMCRKFSSPAGKSAKKLFLLLSPQNVSMFIFFRIFLSPQRTVGGFFFTGSKKVVGGVRVNVRVLKVPSSLWRFRNHITILTPKAVARF